ncbi:MULTISPECIES: addiction module family protein [Chryseobacterium]|uniref:Addiction module component n=1 Tax=Chryseobacterium salivictor TaxID=2547600 RepID=A0A4P6ZJB0_9FLAO|nr:MULTISPECIES: addiction module family protein [Chryseobacterium]MDQ0476425.1 uncharacterized protein (DUF2336 family) [Chryseobacterium sp. MDT2-18]QBO59657.1 hypothetical protein NBC122_02857 [Chryseobacterium salivictor]
METTLDIRKKIHEFIDHADERILRIINAIILTEQETAPMNPDSFYEELDNRKERHLKGESKSYTWEEVKTKARAAVK